MQAKILYKIRKTRLIALKYKVIIQLIKNMSILGAKKGKNSIDC